MVPFVIKGNCIAEPALHDAFFADFVSFGVFFFEGPKAPPITFFAGAYPIHALPTHAKVKRPTLATIHYNQDLADTLTAALADWQLIRVPISAAANGALGGRPRAVDDATFEKIKLDLRSAGQAEVAKRYGLLPSTLSNMLRRDRREGSQNA